MEIFLPSFLIIILAGVIVFTVLPRFGPLILTVLSIVLLIFGTHHHYKLFRDEYRLSTWYSNIGFLAPALVLGVALFFILGYILSFFGSGVPVPSMPVMPNIPTMESVDTAVGNVLNNTLGAVTNTLGTVTNAVTNTVTNTVNGVNNAAANMMGQNVNRGANNGLRRTNNNGSLANKLP